MLRIVVSVLVAFFFAQVGLAALAGGESHGTVLRVGPGQPLRSIAEAARQAKDGDVVEVEAGTYSGDVAVWTQDRITVRGVGGQVRLNAAGASAEQKGTWVVRSRSMRVENIEFVGARVPHLNGAGIRLEKGRLVVRNCRFEDNENGILTGNDPSIELEIESSEFGHNGAGDGRSHNLYVGAIGKLKVMGSYFHHARVGHLLKSRAAENVIAYNRLTDEAEGSASYELEFPSGGVAYVIGNIIQQGPKTQNPHIVSFGAEGYKWPRNALYLVNNTLVDDRPQRGIFLRMNPGAEIRAVNNLLVGVGSLEMAGKGDYQANFDVDKSQVVDAPRYDYRLKSSARLAGKAVNPGDIEGVSLAPEWEYVHPRQTRAIRGVKLPGALQGIGH
jgi:hypothetical protein